MTFKIIHSGLFPETLNASTTFNLFANFFGFNSLVVSFISFLIDSLNSSKSSSSRSNLIASAPIPALKLSAPNSFWASINSSSVNNWSLSSGVRPGSNTIKLSKYNTFSRSLSIISNIKPILLGNDFKNHICATGEANSICPILSLLTFDKVTSTPHFSHTIPLNFILLYLPHKHS